MTRNEIDGILIVDKPQGMTSHDVVDFIRQRFGIKKVGHAGTLDPMATGVLVMLLGKATKSALRFLNEDKVYEGTLVFGISTDTGDAEGKILHKDGLLPNEAALKRVFNSFVGKIPQVPPMFSAKKINGSRLYDLARRGIEVKREPMLVEVKEIEIKRINLPEVDFKIRSSKGTYIRQIAADIGERAGCGAHLKKLRRVESGAFNIKNAISFDALKAKTKEGLSEGLLRIQEI